MIRNRPFPIRPAVVLSIFAALFIVPGCTLPKIIVLHDPLSVEEHLKLGTIYQSQGKFDLAGRQYRDALRKDPRSLSALLLVGELSFLTKQYREAEAAYKKAMKLQPENGDIMNNLSLVYLEQDTKLDLAEALVRRALERTPGHRAYYLDTLGMVLLRREKVSEAINALKEAITGLPKEGNFQTQAYEHLATAYRASGNEEAAREAEQAALCQDPDRRPSP